MEAIVCVAHVLNRCPTKVLKTITPFEAWYDRLSLIDYMCVFDCLDYAHVHQQLHGKLDDKAINCIFVGYNGSSKGYRLFNSISQKIVESCDVIFVENCDQPMVIFYVPHVQTHDVFEGLLSSSFGSHELQ